MLTAKRIHNFRPTYSQSSVKARPHSSVQISQICRPTPVAYSKEKAPPRAFSGASSYKLFTLFPNNTNSVLQAPPFRHAVPQKVGGAVIDAGSVADRGACFLMSAIERASKKKQNEGLECRDEINREDSWKGNRSRRNAVDFVSVLGRKDKKYHAREKNCRVVRSSGGEKGCRKKVKKQELIIKAVDESFSFCRKTNQDEENMKLKSSLSKTCIRSQVKVKINHSMAISNLTPVRQNISGNYYSRKLAIRTSLDSDKQNAMRSSLKHDNLTSHSNMGGKTRVKSLHNSVKSNIASPLKAKPSSALKRSCSSKRLAYCNLAISRSRVKTFQKAQLFDRIFKVEEGYLKLNC